MKRILSILTALFKPSEPKSITINRNPSFVLLRGITGNIFWTTDDGSNYELDGFTVLHRGTDCDEMTSKWNYYYHQGLKK